MGHRLELQQTRVSLQRTLNQTEQTAHTAVIGLLQNGISTPYRRVILAQRDLAATQSALIQAQVSYAKALIALELAEGSILERNGIHFDQAFAGGVWKTFGKP